MAAQQNKLAFVTGTSRGIGKALAEKLLDEGYTVIGLSRTNTINHPHFTFVKIDFNSSSELAQFKFTNYLSATDANEILLVNNAGVIGEIKPVGKISNTSIATVMQVNTIAPQILMNNFISAYSKTAKTGHILNISSGAGKYAIDAWATYCASKAALDLFSVTTQEEMTTRQISHWSVHSIAPGVVDTEMQGVIRDSDPKMFLQHEKFINLKIENELTSPVTVAEKLFRVIRAPKTYPETLLSVRDF